MTNLRFLGVALLTIGACGSALEPDAVTVTPYYAQADVRDVPALDHTTRGVAVGLTWDMGRRARASEQLEKLPIVVHDEVQRVVDAEHSPRATYPIAEEPRHERHGVIGLGLTGDLSAGGVLTALIGFLGHRHVKRRRAAKTKRATA